MSEREPMDLPRWWRAWEPIVTAATAHMNGIDAGDVLDGYDAADVATAALVFISRMVESLGPGPAAQVCQAWGLMAASRDAVAPAGSEQA